MKRENTASHIEGILKEFLPARGLAFWDAAWYKEGGRKILRVYIIKPGAYVGTEDCEAVSRVLSDLFDREPPCPDPYYLEVSSAGLERHLSKEEHFRSSLGEHIKVTLYRPYEGQKKCKGILRSFDEDRLVIETDAGGCIAIPRAYVADVSLAVEF